MSHENATQQSEKENVVTENSVLYEKVPAIDALFREVHDLNPALAMSMDPDEFIEYARHYDTLKKRLSGIKQLIEEDLIPLKREFDTSGTIDIEIAMRMDYKIESFMQIAVKTNLRRIALCCIASLAADELEHILNCLGQDIVAEYYYAEYEYYEFLLEICAIEESAEFSLTQEYFTSAMPVSDDAISAPTWLLALERYKLYLDRAIGTEDQEPDAEYSLEDYDRYVAWLESCRKVKTLLKTTQGSDTYMDNIALLLG